MHYRFYKSSDPFVTAAKERIIEIAQLAFTGIPREEVLKRFDQYEEVLLVLRRDIQSPQGIVGFNFCSLHRSGKTLIVGGRLVAIHPKYKGKGYLRAASLHILRRYYVQLLCEFIVGKTRQLVIFSRQCNPVAYCLLHGGQSIYPDLVNRHRSEIHAPEWAIGVYRFLQQDLNLKKLDVETGVVAEGASQAGIHTTTSFANATWKTSWQDYVSEGSELISLIPVSPLFPLQYAQVIGRRWLRVVNPIACLPMRGRLASALTITVTLVATLLGLLALVCRQKKTAAFFIHVWAKICLWFYGIKLNVTGNIPDTQGLVFLARHTSLLDTFIYPALLPRSTRYVAKKELARIPLIAAFFEKMGGVFIDRNAPLNAARTLLQMRRSLRPDDHVFIHPEGTRSAELHPSPILPGFLALTNEQSILVPISVFGGDRLWPRGQKYADSGSVDVVIGEPLTVDSMQSEVVTRALTKAFEAAIASQLNRN